MVKMEMEERRVGGRGRREGQWQRRREGAEKEVRGGGKR